MKVFLDDIRMPVQCVEYMHSRIGKNNLLYAEQWIVVRNYEEFVKVIYENVDKITHVSFDHDLADEHYKLNAIQMDDYERGRLDYKERTGVDCAKYLKDFYRSYGRKLPIIFVHSMNPIGAQNIISIFK